MNEKKSGKAWIYTDADVRHRLNLYKTMLGIAGDSIMDQTETIRILLDNAGAPRLETARRAAQQVQP